MGRAYLPWTLVSLAISMILGCAGCESPTQCENEPLVKLSGRLSSPAGPVTGYIFPETVDHSPLGWTYTATDDDGRFSFCVPPGRYLLRIGPLDQRTCYYAADGCVWSHALADTLHLVSPSAEINAVFGALRCEIALPDYEDGTSVAVKVASATGYMSLAAEVHNERVTPEFRALPVGDYVLSLWVGEGPYPRFYYPGSRSYEEAESLAIEAGKLLTVAHSMPARARLTGSVLGSWQRIHPTSTPSINLYTDDQDLLLRSRTDHEGLYSIDVMLPETVRVAVSVDRRAHWIGGEDFVDAQRFVLEPGATVQVDPHLESGIVCAFDETGPSAGDELQLLLFGEDGNQILSETHQVNAAREVGISFLTPGRYTLQLQMPSTCEGWLSQWYDGGATQEEATPIAVGAADETVVLPVQLSLGGQVSGTIERRDGIFIGYHVVSVVSATDSTEIAAETDPDPVLGTFCIGGLPDGAYCMLLEASYGSDRAWFPGVNSFTDADALTIQDGSVIGGLQWWLD